MCPALRQTRPLAQRQLGEASKVENCGLKFILARLVLISLTMRIEFGFGDTFSREQDTMTDMTVSHITCCMTYTSSM